MTLRIDWTEYDDLTPRDRYDAVGKLIDEAKASVAAKRAEIAAGLASSYGYEQAAEILGISVKRVYALVKRWRELATTETTEYAVWDATIPGGRTLRDGLTTALGDAATSIDVDAVEEDYRAAINAALHDQGITLAGEIFYGPYPRPDHCGEDIAALVETVDLWEIVARHDADVTTA